MNKSEGDKPTSGEQGEATDKKGASPSVIKEDDPTTDMVVQEESRVPSTYLSTSVNRPFDSSPLDSLNTPAEIANFAEKLVDASMCPYKTAQDATIALITGKELGLSLAATLGGVYPIEGRPSLGIHIKKGLLLQNQITFKKVKDFEDYFEFAIIKDSKPSVIGYGYLSDLPEMQNRANGLEVKKKKIDIRTLYIFTRYFNTPKGVIRNTAEGMFSYQMAVDAGLTERGTYQKYLRDMLANRAFGRGASEIADDLLHGMYNFSDLADLPNSGVTYWIDDEGREHIVDNSSIT